MHVGRLAPLQPGMRAGSGLNVIQPTNAFTSIVGNEAGNTNLRHDVTALGSLLQAQDAKSVQRPS